MNFTTSLRDIIVDTVRAPGVPNAECICLRAIDYVDTTNLGMMIGYRIPNGTVTPLRDRLFWFGGTYLPPNTQINLFTGEGAYNMSELGNGSYLHNMFWGQPFTVFNSSEIVPILFRVQHANIGTAPSPIALPYLDEVLRSPR
ncbi:hypothetical protein [Pseudomonas sp. CGJS7]|uniref:hypothetical protein n=1 Tax=Pseudomonas sp. CGJS7 TaxID=3109348 RepID=UPI0030094D52